MTLGNKVSLWMLCVALGACSGAEKHTRDADDQADAGEVGDEPIDTNGDGVVDAPLPGADSDLDAGMTSTGGDGGPVLVGSDSGALPFPTNDAGQILCGAGPCACSDGKDNDNDGVTDLADPECVSSWDNDEGSFATGIPGDNRDDACQDCFFDGNSGSGNDGCYLPSSCISQGNASSGRRRCDSCEQTDQCRNFCKAYTPNGCDCFGCCTVRLANGNNVNVTLGAGCNIDGNDVTGCDSCVPNDSCRNECGKCELCPGKTLADLPAECFMSPPTGDGGTSTGNDAGNTSSSDGGSPQPPPPGYACEDGAQLCGAGQPACPSGHGCDFGCCVLIPVILL